MSVSRNGDGGLCRKRLNDWLQSGVVVCLHVQIWGERCEGRRLIPMTWCVSCAKYSQDNHLIITMDKNKRQGIGQWEHNREHKTDLGHILSDID